MSRKESPPNFQKSVALPDCCGTCLHFEPAGSAYEDSPVDCEKYRVRRSICFDSLCDGYERDHSDYPAELKEKQ